MGPSEIPQASAEAPFPGPRHRGDAAAAAAAAAADSQVGAQLKAPAEQADRLLVISDCHGDHME
jgi:hypothetical protein